MEIEILTCIAERGDGVAIEAVGSAIVSDEPGEAGERLLYEPGSSEGLSASVVQRQRLANDVIGPAIVQEAQTTTIVPPGWRVTPNARGDLIVARDDAFDRVSASGLSDQVRLQVLWDRLISIVEEQAQAIIRSAFSTTVREAGDLSAGIFDPTGRMLAQAVTGTPGHVNAMAASVGYFLERYPPDTMKPDDVFVTNDPWLGTGHLFDFTVVTPVFYQDSMVGLFASTVHVVDIGGLGFSPDSGQVYEEGLCIPIMRLFDAGEANETVFEIIRANVREPVQVIGDLYSLTSSNDVGARRLVALMEEYGIAELDTIGAHIIETSERAMIEAIAKLPQGRYENRMTVDGYDSPIDLVASLEISRDRISVDYAGTSPTSPFGINVPLTYTEAYTSFGIRCIVGHAVPNNSGSLKPIEVNAAPGSILNAERPCAVNVRHVIGQMLPDVMLGCLGKALPGAVPAEGSSSLWNPMLSGGHGVVGEHGYGNATPFAVTIFHSGATGARPGKPGLSATAYPSGVRNTPVEITEAISPLIYRRKEYRENSGGAGAYCSGDGQVIELEHSEGAPFALFALFDRIDHAARGRDGGEDGAAGSVHLADGTPLKGKGKQIVPAGGRLVLELPGGGGLGRIE